jgi:hypothetical protein
MEKRRRDSRFNPIVFLLLLLLLQLLPPKVGGRPRRKGRGGQRVRDGLVARDNRCHRTRRERPDRKDNFEDRGRERHGGGDDFRRVVSEMSLRERMVGSDGESGRVSCSLNKEGIGFKHMQFSVPYSVLVDR